jgi:hypothetical protein
MCSQRSTSVDVGEWTAVDLRETRKNTKTAQQSNVPMSPVVPRNRDFQISKLFYKINLLSPRADVERADKIKRKFKNTRDSSFQARISWFQSLATTMSIASFLTKVVTLLHAMPIRTFPCKFILTACISAKKVSTWNRTRLPARVGAFFPYCLRWPICAHHDEGVSSVCHKINLLPY